MFNNDSNSSIVMFAGPYPHHTKPDAGNPPAVAHFEAPQHPYFHQHQQRTIEIIELVEVPPPTRREHISVPDSSSYASSSCCSSDEDKDEEEEEVVAESYCSSEEEDEFLTGVAETAKERAAAHNAFQARMRRIESWRDAYAKAVGTELAPSPSRTKRKSDANDDDDDDSHSRSSKRSRTSMSGSCSIKTTASLRSVHSCSACDTCFPDRNSLRNHGTSPNEACRAAVEYDFEQ